MISQRLQIFAILAVLLFLAVLILLLRKNRLSLKYTLLWLFSGVILLVLSVFPQLLDAFARLIGVYSSVNALFAVMLCCGLLLMISFTAIVSKEKEEIVRLVQELSLLENRLRELEGRSNGPEEACGVSAKRGRQPARGDKQTTREAGSPEAADAGKDTRT